MSDEAAPTTYPPWRGSGYIDKYGNARFRVIAGSYEDESEVMETVRNTEMMIRELDNSVSSVWAYCLKESVSAIRALLTFGYEIHHLCRVKPGVCYVVFIRNMRGNRPDIPEYGTSVLGAGLLVYTRNPDTGEYFYFLSLQAASGRRSRSYGTPGGAVNLGETLIHAVIREYREETGINVLDFFEPSDLRLSVMYTMGRSVPQECHNDVYAQFVAELPFDRMQEFDASKRMGSELKELRFVSQTELGSSGGGGVLMGTVKRAIEKIASGDSERTERYIAPSDYAEERRRWYLC